MECSIYRSRPHRVLSKVYHCRCVERNPMRSNFLGFFVAIGLAVAAYVAFPFWSVYSLATSVERGDVVAVESAIDWERLRAGLRTNLLREMTNKVSKDVNKDSGGAAVGAALGMALAGPLLDRILEANVNAAGLIQVYSDNLNNLTSSISDQRFVDSSTFQFSLVSPKNSQVKVVVVMEMQGLRWRVERVVLPESLLAEMREK